MRCVVELYFLCRTLACRCWGGGSGGEETHGVEGCVRAVRVRSHNHGAALCEKEKKKKKKATCWRLQPISALLSSNSIQIGNAGCKEPTNDGRAGVS